MLLSDEDVIPLSYHRVVHGVYDADPSLDIGEAQEELRLALESDRK